MNTLESHLLVEVERIENYWEIYVCICVYRLTGWGQLHNVEADLSSSHGPAQQHRTVASDQGDSHSPHQHLAHISIHWYHAYIFGFQLYFCTSSQKVV